MTTPPDATERRRGLEAFLLAVLAVVPVVPHLTLLLRVGVRRFGLFGDFALLELATRHVGSGDTLIGPYSRFRWHHPGPLFFYIGAPFEALFGPASTGLYVATCVVNAAAAATLPFCARLFAGRSHAVAAVFVVLGWFAAFGNVITNPWNPIVIVLPLTAFLVTAALLAGGRTGAVYPCVVFGTLVAQTHVAAISTVMATGGVALVAFLASARRRSAPTRDTWPSRNERRHLLAAAVILFALFLPPLVEQLTAPKGNVTRLVSFFVERQEPLKPIGVAARHWVIATSWMPERILGRSLVDEPFTPLVTRWDALPLGITRKALAIAILQTAMTLLCGLYALRKRDLTSSWFIALGAVAGVVAVSALQAIVGPSYHYLIFWVTAVSSVTWIGVLSAILAALDALSLTMPRARRVLAPALGISVLGAVVFATSLQREWLMRYQAAPGSRESERDDLRALHAELRGLLTQRGDTAVIHSDGAWDVATAMVLELEKDDVAVTVPERNDWLYTGIRGNDTVKNALHVYFSTTPSPLPIARCLELITKHGDISMYRAPIDRVTCESP